MSTRLLLIRHGETVDNVNKIMQGQTPGKLTPNGVEQARELAMRLKQEHIDAFVSSDLKRAVDTCVEIAAPHFDGDRAKALDSIMQTPLLRERDWGSFTGRFIPDLKDAKWTDDIETTDVMRKRAQAFIDLMRSRYVIQSVFFNKPMQDVPRMENAEMRELIL